MKRKKYILSCLEERGEAEEDAQAAQGTLPEETSESQLGNSAIVRSLCNKTRRLWQDEFLIDSRPQGQPTKLYP